MLGKLQCWWIRLMGGKHDWRTRHIKGAQGKRIGVNKVCRRCNHTAQINSRAKAGAV